MKLLYGVQATGNGHITRARTLAPELQKQGIDVEFVFSGREKNKLFSMEPFGEYRCYKGLTFVTEKGRINYFKTVLQNNLLRFISDIRNIDFVSLSALDLH